MVAEQLRPNGIQDERVLAAMADLPREEFVPYLQRRLAYADHPIAIGGGQTISQPLVVAAMTQAVAPQPGETVLEVGSGSGYQSAVLARLAGRVIGIERDRRLAERGAETLRRLGITNAEIHHGDGSLGWPDAAPYDAIVVSAAAPSVPPALLAQLASPGRMVVPVESGRLGQQDLLLIRREGERITTQPIFPVRFVPLVEGTDG
ncbi:MAG: protein-L-isoaspartate(D-aspartate) O-methyltransferase [Chloroflexi bacterium]|nr:MAG: protein-L-isoaspartate(D-aspartate) O-methyltransferase [Chloroflexota bacterium]